MSSCIRRPPPFYHLGVVNEGIFPMSFPTRVCLGFRVCVAMDYLEWT